MERRKLFSEPTSAPRRKLFCGPEVIAAAEPKRKFEREVVCMDCGYRMLTAEETSELFCPKCGGRRFNVESSMVVSNEEKEFSRRKLFSSSEEDAELIRFQREFSETLDPLELKLKEFSGKEIDYTEFEREFSDLLSDDELREYGYGDINDGKVKIFSNAFDEARLFSTIRMTITKTLEIDPETFNRAASDEGKCGIIRDLACEDRLCPKAIVMIKKAHNLPLDADNNSWIHDSGICNDLGIEFGGSKQELPDFKRTIDERYPDAPDNIIDLLKKLGTIKVDGNHVEIIK